MEKVFILIAVIVVMVIISWPINLYKLSQCDFKPDYKCEALHTFGIYPPLAIFTVWIDTDE